MRGGEYREIRSIHGHDAFLLEKEQVAAIVRDALKQEVPIQLCPDPLLSRPRLARAR